MVSSRLAIKLWLEVVTYALVGVVVAIDVEDRQNIDIHLVEQAGHLRVTAIGGQSLRKNGKKFCTVIGGSLCIKYLSCPSSCLPYLLDKPLAESRRDPFSSVDTTVHEDGRLGGAGLFTELWLLKVITKHLFDSIFGMTTQRTGIADKS